MFPVVDAVFLGFSFLLRMSLILVLYSYNREKASGFVRHDPSLTLHGSADIVRCEFTGRSDEVQETHERSTFRFESNS